MFYIKNLERRLNKMIIIKFRAQKIDSNEWVYGYYYKEIGINNLSGEKDATKDKHWIKSLEIEKGLITDYQIKPETVCLYTGLNDKNGKEIYEKDLCKLTNINYIDESYSEIIETIEMSKGCWCGGDYYLHSYDKVEIIGNIFENPELL